MERFTIRPATNADGATVADLVFTVLAEYGLAPAPGSTDVDLDDIEGSYRRRGGAFDVIQDGDGAVVGCVGVFPITSETCELRKMYLRRDARGQGLGRRLLDHALGRARALGFGRIVLETAAVLKEAIGLYVSYGFRPYRADHLASRCDQAYALDLRALPTRSPGE